MQPRLRIDGEVNQSVELTHDDLTAIDAHYQIADVSQLDPQRRGSAVSLDGLLALCEVKASAKFLGVHAARDDFHASVPLDPLRGRAVLIYRVDDAPLAAKKGGPFRLLIPDFAACHTDEIDECANVKFVDHIELTAEKGLDNRPDDDAEHEALHRREEP